MNTQSLSLWEKAALCQIYCLYFLPLFNKKDFLYADMFAFSSCNKKKKSAQILALHAQVLYFPFACDFSLFESLLARDKNTACAQMSNKKG